MGALADAVHQAGQYPVPVGLQPLRFPLQLPGNALEPREEVGGIEGGGGGVGPGDMLPQLALQAQEVQRIVATGAKDGPEGQVVFQVVKVRQWIDGLPRILRASGPNNFSVANRCRCSHRSPWGARDWDCSLASSPVLPRGARVASLPM